MSQQFQPGGGRDRQEFWQFIKDVAALAALILTIILVIWLAVGGE